MQRFLICGIIFISILAPYRCKISYFSSCDATRAKMLRQTHMFNQRAIFIKANLELFIWIAALLWLAFLNPDSNPVSLCPLKFMGFHYCPGCGLGRSIALLFRGRFADSFTMHPLGSFALVVIGYRIFQLGRTALSRKEQIPAERENA